jgi:CzcA family heavy metal efflux pump
VKNFFVSYRNPVTVLILLILAGGVYAYINLQTSLFPEITFPKIKIIAEAGLQPVDKMMVTVTRPIENAVRQIPGLKLVRSTTSKGSCEISAFLNWKTDIDLSLQRIESRIAQVRNQLPPDLQLTVEKMNPSILPVMGYTVESNNRSPIELKMVAEYTIKPFLSQVQGVAEVRVTGGKTKEYWIQLDSRRMSTIGITPDMVNAALSQTNFIRSNGYISDFKFLYLSVTDATVHNMEDLKSVVIRNDGKRIVRLEDIGEVSINEAVEYTRINANGKSALLVAIIKQPDANLLQIDTDMEKKITTLKQTLPKDIDIRPYYIQAEFVKDAVSSVADSLWMGLALAIFVSVLFLRSVKASLTLLLTIPVTLSLTLIVLYSIGYTINIMTLGAIAAAIGLIIDDAIVVVEQIHRTHEEHPGTPTSALLQKAIKYLFPAMLGSSISTIVIFIPFVLMTGVAGAYFKVMTNTMIITLICSFFVTWLCLPVIYLLLSRHHKGPIKELAAHPGRRQRWITFFIRRPGISFIFSGALIALIIILIPRLETGFLPEMDEGSIILDYASPPGTSLDETDRMLREAEKLIQSVPEVATYSRRTGTQMGFFITEPNTGDYLIQLKKDRTRTTDEVIADIRTRIESTQPALRIDFGQVIGDMLGDLMSSVQPIEIKIYGNDRQVLQELSQHVAGVLERVPGTADVFDGIVIAGPTVSIEPDYRKLSALGITPANFQLQVQTALEGNIVGNILEKEQVSAIRFVYQGNRNRTIENLNNLPVFLPNGQARSLSLLATIKHNPGDAEIEREDLQTMGVITARLEGRDLGTVVKDIQLEIARQIKLPASYHIEYGGAYAEQTQSFNELLMILVSASLLVFAVILFLYTELRASLTILLIAVSGFAGSYLALYLTDTPLNVGSYTGLIMIVGIIGENAIFTFLQFREAMVTQPVDEAIVYAISTRLRPKLMTALGAIIALLPLAFGIGAGAQLHKPLAIAVIGGFIIALPLLLIILPSMLRLLYKPTSTTFIST